MTQARGICANPDWFDLGGIEEVVGKVREDIRDPEDKVDPFIREQLKLKRDLCELLESRTA